jgi:hypothetical protein
MTNTIIRMLFLDHFSSTFYMVGLIWFVQIVHYPLLANVERASFVKYEKRHTSLTTWVVGPPMSIEGVTALLLIWLHPASITGWSFWMGMVLLGIIWLSTLLVQVLSLPKTPYMLSTKVLRVFDSPTSPA